MPTQTEDKMAAAAAGGRARTRAQNAVLDALGQPGIAPAKGRTIALLTPTLGRVTMLWADARMHVIWPMNTGKAILPLYDKRGGEVGEVRNALVQMVLTWEKHSPGVEVAKVFWLDDDVVCNSPACMLSLGAMDVPVASGVYYCKGDFGDPLIFAGPSTGTLTYHPAPDDVKSTDDGGWVEAWGWAQGLSLVDLAVYKRMAAELDLGEDKYGNPQWYKQPGFGVTEEGGVITGGTEDFHFFDNCSKLGYRPRVDLTKHAFGWHLDLNTLKGYPERQFDQWTRKQPIVWPAAGSRKETVWT